MPKDSTFKVSKKGTEGVEVTFVEPENINDKRWAELGIDEAGINELAVQNLVIKIQSGARNRLDDGKQAVQDYVDNYKYGQRTGGGTRSVVLKADEVKNAQFTEEQIAMLRAAGVKIPGLDDTEETGDENENENGGDDDEGGEEE